MKVRHTDPVEIRVEQHLQCVSTGYVTLPQGVEWHNVGSWQVKHDKLRLELKDGTPLAIEIDSSTDDGIDWSFPNVVEIQDDNGEVIDSTTNAGGLDT